MFYKVKNKIYNLILNKIISKTSKKYYWEIRAKTFAVEWSGYQANYYEQHYILKDIIQDVQPNKILEIGCGFGRNIKFLIEECNVEPSQITAFDFSSNMIQESKKFLGDYFDKLYEIRQADITDIPYADNSFDFVFIHGVMMHIGFEKIQKAISEVVRVSSKNIVQVEEYYETKTDQNINDFTYCHDYKTLYGNIHRLRLNNNGLLMFKVVK